MKKYKWNTHRIVKETEDTITLYFDTQQGTVAYLPGQYLNIKCIIGGQEVIRSYSFSSLPSDEFPSITVKRVAGGKMSNYIFEHAADISSWDIEAPFGNFVLEKDVAEQAQIVLMAGGSGISPLLAMLKSTYGTPRVPLLLYSSRSPEETIFFGLLEEMVKEGKVAPYYSFTDSSFRSADLRHIAGRFSAIVIHSIIRSQVTSLEQAQFYICGPKGLMELYKEVLLGMRISEHQIHMEYFDPVATENTPFENDGISRDVLVNYYEDNYIDEELQTYECTALVAVQAGQSILQAIQEHDIKVPSSCMNGSCGACWAIKANGEVWMRNNQALTGEDIAEGIVLLCQSYPQDENVTITLS